MHTKCLKKCWLKSIDKNAPANDREEREEKDINGENLWEERKKKKALERQLFSLFSLEKKILISKKPENIKL